MEIHSALYATMYQHLISESKLPNSYFYMIYDSMNNYGKKGTKNETLTLEESLYIVLITCFVDYKFAIKFPY